MEELKALLELNKKLHLENAMLINAISEKNEKIEREKIESARWERRFNNVREERDRLSSLMYDLMGKLHGQGFK